MLTIDELDIDYQYIIIINPFVTYNVHRMSTFLCQDAVPRYAVRPKITGFQG